VPSHTNADAEATEHILAELPLGKLTGYRLLNIVLIFTIGVVKSIISLKSQSITPTGLELAGGSALAALLYWIGLYEAVEPWGWVFHVNWAPGISFGSKYFLGGVLWSLVNPWRFFPFFLAIYICITRLPFFADTDFWNALSGALSGLLGSLLAETLPTEWLVWHHIPVWAPVRRFYRRYGLESEHSAGGQYRLIGNIGFCLGPLSAHLLLFVAVYLISSGEEPH